MNTVEVSPAPPREAFACGIKPSPPLRPRRVLVVDDDANLDALMEKPLNIPLLIRAIQRFAREDKDRRVRRRGNPLFVTELLVNGEHDAGAAASSAPGEPE